MLRSFAVGEGGAGEGHVCGVAGGVDTGCAAEGVDFYAGVICEDDLVRGVAGSRRWP